VFGKILVEIVGKFTAIFQEDPEKIPFVISRNFPTHNPSYNVQQKYISKKCSVLHSTCTGSNLHNIFKFFYTLSDTKKCLKRFYHDCTGPYNYTTVTVNKKCFSSCQLPE